MKCALFGLLLLTGLFSASTFADEGLHQCSVESRVIGLKLKETNNVVEICWTKKKQYTFKFGPTRKPEVDFLFTIGKTGGINRVNDTLLYTAVNGDNKYVITTFLDQNKYVLGIYNKNKLVKEYVATRSESGYASEQFTTPMP